MTLRSTREAEQSAPPVWEFGVHRANFVTIIGIPFGIQHLKLAECALAPIGKTVVPKEVAAEARRRNARGRMDRF